MVAVRSRRWGAGRACRRGWSTLLARASCWVGEAVGARRTVDLTGLPRVTFTQPQIAGAGLTEAQARLAGYQVATSVLPLEAVPRALVNRAQTVLLRRLTTNHGGNLRHAGWTCFAPMAAGVGEAHPDGGDVAPARAR